VQKLGALIVLTVLGVSAPLFPQEKVQFVLRASILAILEDNGMEGDPSPILPSPGFSVSIPIPRVPLLTFEPGIDLYSTYYGYSYVLDRAVPYAIENRSAIVIGTMLSLPVEFGFRIRGIAGFHAFAGPSVDARLCLVADGLEGSDYDDAASQTADISGYFWSEGRWVQFLMGGGFDFPFTSKTMLGVEFRLWYPAYHLWTGEDLPATENLKLALGLTLVFR